MLPRIFPFDYRETKEIAAKIKQAGECYFGLPFQTSEPPSQFSDPAPDSAKYWSRKKKRGTGSYFGFQLDYDKQFTKSATLGFQV